MSEIRFSQFNGGVSGDPKEPSLIKCGLCKHFNLFDSPYKLVPYRSTENDTNDGSTSTGMKQYDIRNFQLGLDGKLYGLGYQTGGDATKCYLAIKADPTTGNWSVSAAYKSTLTNGVDKRGCFIEWQGKWWTFGSTNKVISCPLAGTWDDNAGAIATAPITVAQGIRGADGNMYMFYNNKIVRVSAAGVVTDDAGPVLPSDMRITSVAPYNSYLAIGMAYGTSATAIPTGKSKVFLWDMVTTTVYQDMIDWGEGALMILGNVEGSLVGVSDKYMSSTLGITAGSMVIRQWSGGVPRVVKEIVVNQTVTLGRFILDRVEKNNKLYWVASVPFGTSTSTESTYHLGVWCYGRKDANSDFSLSLDYIEDGIDTANWKIMSFGNAGNYWFFNHSADGSITKTDDAANYTTNSIYETQKFSNGKQNTLISAYVECERQPADGQITLKYKKNGGGTWRTIFTNTANELQKHEANCIETGTTGTVTLSNGTPCTATLASHGLLPGDTFFFSTSANALPTGITANQTYFVISTGLTVDAFQFALTEEGTAINTTSAGTGVHTVNYNTELGEFRDMELSVISVGGTIITGIGFKYESLDKDTVS